MPLDRRFRLREHIRLRREFADVFARKRSTADEALVVYLRENGRDWSRLGISVGVRIGPAVTRNRVRRRIREAFRLSKDRLPQGWDIVCVARPRAADPRHDLGRSLRTLVTLAASRRLRG